MPKVSQSQGLLTIFDQNLWIGLGISFAVLVITIYTFRLIKGQYKFGYTLLQITLIHLGLPILPCKGPEQALLVCSSVYGLIIATAYQSGIISALTTEIPPYQPQTLREIIDQGETKFGMLISGRRFFGDPDDDYKYIIKNAILCRGLSQCLKDGILSRKYCVLSNRKFLDHITPSFFLSGGHKVYYEIKNIILPFFPEVYMQKNHFLQEPFDYYIGQLIAGGFIGKWEEDLRLLPIRGKIADKFTLRLDAFEGPFILLLIGNFICLCVFVVELVMNYLGFRTK